MSPLLNDLSRRNRSTDRELAKAAYLCFCHLDFNQELSLWLGIQSEIEGDAQNLPLG